jgi:hypothetical protein
VSASGRMKNEQLVEVDNHPTDVSIDTSPEPYGGGPVVDGKNGWQAGGWIPKALRETVAGH